MRAGCARRSACLAVLTAVLGAWSCSGAGSADGNRAAPSTPAATVSADDTLRIVLYTWPASLNPYLSADTNDLDVLHQVLEGLVDLSSSAEFVGRLAERWSFSADGRELTFELRPGVKWHDGKPFTSEDVRFTYDFIQKAASDPGWRASLAEVEKIDTPSPTRVVVRYREPFAPALASWMLPILPAHLFPDGPAADPDTFAGVGTGPYKVAGRKQGDSILLDRNPEFQRPAPSFAHVVFKMMPSTGEALQAVKDGYLDVARMRPADWAYNTPDETWKDAIQKVKNPTYGYSYVGWNQDGTNPLFQDRRVRRALAMAWNPDEGLQTVNKVAEIAFGPYPVSSKFFNRELKPLPFNQTSARSELEAAGWSDHDGDGVRDRDGLPFKFKLLTLDGVQFTSDIATMLTNRFKEVGVKVDYVRVTYPEMLQRLKAGKFDAFVLQWSGDVDPDLYSVFHSSQHGNGQNFTGYTSAEVDQLLVEGRRTLDPDKRRAVYQHLDEVLYHDQPCLFLYFTPVLWGVSTRIANVHAQPGGLLLGHPGLLEWRATRKAAPARPPSPTPAAPGR